MLTIGNLKLKSRLILAPMAGITDLPFRMLNRRFGCELAFIEMINVRSLSYKSKKTARMLASGTLERPLGIQLLGKEPKFIHRALDILQDYNFDLLDFNAACPARKVVRRGEGASLLKKPKALGRILKFLVKNSRYPVTVKIRSGWDSDSVNATETALCAQDAGVSAVFLHGRTGLQGYGGSVDYRIIAQTKKVLNIPLIASGDVLSAQLADKMFNQTGCDGVLVARGALGNPWIFPESEEFLKSKKTIPSPKIEEVTRVMLEHLEAYIDFYGERMGLIRFRKFFGWYTKGFCKVRPLREKSSRARKREDMVKIIQECLVYKRSLAAKNRGGPRIPADAGTKKPQTLGVFCR